MRLAFNNKHENAIYPEINVFFQKYVQNFFSLTEGTFSFLADPKIFIMPTLL